MKNKHVVKYSDDNYLKCRHCGGDHIHQDRYEIYHRPQEDANHLRLSVYSTDLFDPNTGSYPDFKTKIDQDGVNPSDRRQGLIIFLCCEACCQTTKLAIVQHKGFTLMDYVD